MSLLVANMPSPPHRDRIEPEPESPGTSGFNTPTASSGHHTPAAGYRTAAGTISNAFASLWGAYNQQQTNEGGPSRLRPESSSQSPSASPNMSVPGGWGNLLSWGPAAARQKTSNNNTQTLRKSASPTRTGRAKSGRSRAAIPFDISAPVEATSVEKHDTDHAHPGDSRTPDHHSLGQTGTMPSPRRSPTSSPRRRPLAGIFEDVPASSPPHTPASHSPTSPRARLVHDLPPNSPSLKQESPSGAYATLSRLQSKSSSTKLRSGSGFLWPSATPASSEPSNSPIPHQRPAANWSEAIARTEKLDSYVRRIVFQAGLDYETRPMVVLAACCLPDPKEVDYDALLDRIMDTMDLFVENDYTVVYFAGGGHHRPGWNWIWRAYRRLDRRFRKNLKKLYIVHPTFFTRSLLQFVNTGAYFVSPKFSKKVSQLYTLSALAQHVPLTQIDIPPEVLQWNAKYESHVNLPSKASDALAGQDAADRVFGVDLVRLMGEYGESGGVPRVVRDCVDAILGDFDGIRPAEVEGIFRRSPSSALLKTAQESYDRGHPVSLEQYRDPHIPAVLLKVFLRSLPRPIFAASMYPLIRACPPPPLPNAQVPSAVHEAQAQETIEYLRTRLLPAIEPSCSGILLSYVLEMLHKVAQHREANKMDAANLATVIAPNLVSSGNAIKDVMICRVEGMASMTLSAQPPASRSPQLRKASLSSNADTNTTTLGSIVRFCIERYYEIFDEVNFGAQSNSVQELVDDLGKDDGSRSPSMASRRLPSVYDTPMSQHGALGLDARMHRRGGSTQSSVSGVSVSQPPSPWGMAGASAWHGGGADEDDDDRRSGATGRSITSRDGYRAPAGVHRGTIARNSSGSLRLTKGRLGSNTNLRGSFTPATASGLARPSGFTPVSAPAAQAETDTDALTSQLSGVALTGANAVATFSSPVAERTSVALGGAQPLVVGGSKALTPTSGSSSASASPVLASSPHWGVARGGGGDQPPSPAARRRERTELSQVDEDDDA